MLRAQCRRSARLQEHALPAIAATGGTFQEEKRAAPNVGHVVGLLVAVGRLHVIDMRIGAVLGVAERIDDRDAPWLRASDPPRRIAVLLILQHVRIGPLADDLLRLVDEGAGTGAGDIPKAKHVAQMQVRPIGIAVAARAIRLPKRRHERQPVVILPGGVAPAGIGDRTAAGIGRGDAPATRKNAAADEIKGRRAVGGGVAHGDIERRAGQILADERAAIVEIRAQRIVDATMQAAPVAAARTIDRIPTLTQRRVWPGTGMKVDILPGNLLLAVRTIITPEPLHDHAALLEHRQRSGTGWQPVTNRVRVFGAAPVLCADCDGAPDIQRGHRVARDRAVILRVEWAGSIVQLDDVAIDQRPARDERNQRCCIGWIISRHSLFLNRASGHGYSV